MEKMFFIVFFITEPDYTININTEKNKKNKKNTGNRVI